MTTRIAALELDGGLAWLNVDRPLSLQELRGQVVVLDFWTYCCINCMHVQPTLRAVEEQFAGEPVIVIGVHSAKFAEEAQPQRIAEAIARYEIAHPVVVDDGLAIWQRYAVRSWPTLVVLRPDGTVAAVAPGEPDKKTLARFVAAQLADGRREGTLAAAPFAIPRARAAADGLLRFPGKVSVHPDGRIAVADSGHHRVLVCDARGAVRETAGSGLRGLVDGGFAEAAFDDPEGVAWLGDDVLVCDVRNHALRRLDLAKRRVSTVAGTGELGQRLPRRPLPARQVALRSPWDLAVADPQTIYVAMAGAHQIWKLDLATETITLFAGSGAEALTDGPLMQAAFAQPSGLWLDRARRRLYVADSETSSVRYIDLERRVVVTLVGAGLFEFGDHDGAFETARLQHALGVCGRARDGKTELLVADTYNCKLKLLDEETRSVRTAFAGSGEGALLEPGGLAFAPDGRLYVADTNHHRVVVLDAELTRAEPLRLDGVPAPLSGVAAAAPWIGAPRTTLAQQGGAGWFTAQLVLPDGAALGPGEGRLALTLLAPGGFAVADASPLRLQLEVSRHPDLLVVEEDHQLSATGGERSPLVVALYVTTLPDEPVESEIVATLDFVLCKKGDAGACTPLRAHVRLPIRLAPGGAAELAFEIPLPAPEV